MAKKRENNNSSRFTFSDAKPIFSHPVYSLRHSGSDPLQVLDIWQTLSLDPIRDNPLKHW